MLSNYYTILRKPGMRSDSEAGRSESVLQVVQPLSGLHFYLRCVVFLFLSVFVTAFESVFGSVVASGSASPPGLHFYLRCVVFLFLSVFVTVFGSVFGSVAANGPSSPPGFQTTSTCALLSCILYLFV